MLHKQTKIGSKWDWKQTILTKFWALHIKNHHRMQQKSFSFWYIIWFLLNTRRFWWIFASKSKFRTMLVNSLLNLPNLLSNSDPLRFLFGDYCSKSGINLAKMGLVLCHFNLFLGFLEAQQLSRVFLDTILKFPNFLTEIKVFSSSVPRKNPSQGRSTYFHF